jgi:hypothetical protein
MTENPVRVYSTPNGPQVYLGNVRTHHWQSGAMSAIIGAAGLLLDDNKKRSDMYTSLLLGGTLTFLHDLPDFLQFLDDLRKRP